jgi:hypothetical protein
MHPKNGLYLFDATYSMTVAPAQAMLMKMLPVMSSLHTWHQCLSHAGFSTIMKAVGQVSGMDIDPSSLKHDMNDGDSIHCTSCIMGKHKRLSFPTVVRRASAMAELIHSDMWGPINVASSTGDHYFVVFTDDYTRYSMVYLMLLHG